MVIDVKAKAREVWREYGSTHTMVVTGQEIVRRVGFHTARDMGIDPKQTYEVPADFFFTAKEFQKGQQIQAVITTKIQEGKELLPHEKELLGLPPEAENIAYVEPAREGGLIRDVPVSLQPQITYTIPPSEKEKKEADAFERIPDDRKEMAKYLQQIEGYSFEEMSGWSSAKWSEEKVHVPWEATGGIAGISYEGLSGQTRVTAADLYTMVTLPMLIYGVGAAAYRLAAPKIASVLQGSRPEMWLIRHSGRYAKHAGKSIVSEQIVGYPQIAQGTTLSMSKIEAASTIFDLSVTPRTALVGLSKAPEIITAAPKALPHLIFRGGVLTTGFLKEVGGFSKQVYGGLQLEKPLLIGQKTLPAWSKLPYMPSTIQIGGLSKSVMGAMGIGSVLGLGVSPKTTTKPKRKLKGAERLSLPVIELFKPSVIPVSEAKPVVKTGTKTAISPVIEQIMGSSSITQIIQTTPTKFATPPHKPSWLAPVKPRKKRPKKRGRIKRMKGKKGVWKGYELLYPVATAKGAAKFIFSKD